MLTFFIVLAVLVFVIAIKKGIPLIAFFAGLSCGIATLAKQSGILLLPAIWIFMLFSNKKEICKIKNVFFAMFNSYFLFFLAGFLASTGFWFYKVYLVYGTPFFRADTSSVYLEESTGWFEILRNRPHPFILFSIGILYLCPLFSLACLSIKNFIEEVKKIFSRLDFSYQFVILWLWILIFLIAIVAIGGKEHRYMMPAYPSLAILSAYYLDRMRKWVETKKYKLSGEIIVIAILICTALWTVSIGLDIVMRDGALLLKPF
jgi:4-amino-4-deoxy-L-arabinose transferase-like glycosyltransferase